jgi:hypothetical protein
MGHYSRECPNLPALYTKENVGPSTRKYFVEKKGKTQVHLIKPMNERREKALMGLERSFKIPKEVMDVMAQIKRPMEDIIHPDVSVKMFKEMVKAPKEKKNS